MTFYENKKLFYIDSKKRTGGTDSNFTIELNIEPDDEMDHVVVLGCLIPKSYYLIQVNQNFFDVEELPGVQFPVYLTPGNYSRRSLANTLQAELNAESPNGFKYEITYASPSQPDDGKYIFKVSNNGLIQPKFIFYNHLNEVLGFNKNTIYNFTDNQLKSVNVINLQLENSIYLHSDICQNDNNNVLQDIYASSGEANFSNIHYTCPDILAYSKKMTNSNNNKFTFYILDEDDNEIYLNGLNIIITLMCYKLNPVFKMLKGFIRLQALKD